MHSCADIHRATTKLAQHYEGLYTRVRANCTRVVVLVNLSWSHFGNSISQSLLMHN